MLAARLLKTTCSWTAGVILCSEIQKALSFKQLRFEGGVCRHEDGFSWIAPLWRASMVVEFCNSYFTHPARRLETRHAERTMFIVHEGTSSIKIPNCFANMGAQNGCNPEASGRTAVTVFELLDSVSPFELFRGVVAGLPRASYCNGPKAAVNDWLSGLLALGPSKGQKLWVNPRCYVNILNSNMCPCISIKYGCPVVVCLFYFLNDDACPRILQPSKHSALSSCTMLCKPNQLSNLQQRLKSVGRSNWCIGVDELWCLLLETRELQTLRSLLSANENVSAVSRCNIFVLHRGFVFCCCHEFCLSEARTVVPNPSSATAKKNSSNSVWQSVDNASWGQPNDILGEQECVAIRDAAPGIHAIPFTSHVFLADSWRCWVVLQVLSWHSTLLFHVCIYIYI